MTDVEWFTSNPIRAILETSVLEFARQITISDWEKYSKIQVDKYESIGKKKEKSTEIITSQIKLFYSSTGNWTSQ